MSKLSEILKSEAELSLSKQLVLNLLCTNNHFTEQYASFFKEHDITGPQYNVLRILRGQKGIPANLSTIQERMVHKNSNAGRLVDKLLVKGHVERTVCENNRRKIEVVITNKGLDKLKIIDPGLEILEEKGVEKLSIDDIKVLNVLLEKLRE
jgi:DNA-binding MarR family transcriptional regulator